MKWNLVINLHSNSNLICTIAITTTNNVQIKYDILLINIHWIVQYIQYLSFYKIVINMNVTMPYSDIYLAKLTKCVISLARLGLPIISTQEKNKKIGGESLKKLPVWINLKVAVRLIIDHTTIFSSTVQLSTTFN